MDSMQDHAGARIPCVTFGDVHRIVERDYPETVRGRAWEILRRYQGNDVHRVHLAALKCAGRNLVRLGEAIDLALMDYRDLLVAAEYPSPDPAEDWRQYERWFEGKKST